MLHFFPESACFVMQNQCVLDSRDCMITMICAKVVHYLHVFLQIIGQTLFQIAVRHEHKEMLTFVTISKL